ncbi:MAG: hypothetical protein AB8B85_16375 [Paracoccaceae bacterium]
MPAAKPALGVGSIFGESFSLYFRNFVPMSLVCLVPVLLSNVLSLLVVGVPDPQQLAGDPNDPFAYYTENGLGMIITTVFGIAVWGFIAAAMTSMAYDAKLGNPVSFGKGFSAGLSNIVMVALCVLIVYICFALGLVLLIVPGLLIAAMWFVVVPAIVVERTGFGSLGRSARLTKEYRWPLIGLLVLFLLVAIVVGMVIGLVSGLLVFGAASSGSIGSGFILTMVFNGVVSILMYGVSGAMVALVYARLVEIKEGTGISSLADVFS